MIDIYAKGGASRGALAAALLAFSLGLAAANCGKLPNSYPPSASGETKLETYVNNTTVPGAPRNTAYNGGLAEIVAHVQGTASHVAFYVAGSWGYLGVPGWFPQVVTVDPATGTVTITPEKIGNICFDSNYELKCWDSDGWAYTRVDFMGHARMAFGVGMNQGYWDVLTRPAIIAANGVMTPKIEFETRTRTYFSEDLYDVYQ